MPELPEVETFARQIRPHILEKYITEVTVSVKGERMIAPLSPQELSLQITGASFTAVKRHGKFLIFELSSNRCIVAHLRMSGRFSITVDQADPSPYNRLSLRFEDGSIFNFLDTRRFGTFQLLSKSLSHKGLALLGPDALDPALTPKVFHKTLERYKKAVYKTLLDQSSIAGLGNIYANEALFRSRLHPLKPSNLLSNKESARLLGEIVNILSTALSYKGTTLLDNSYRDLKGNQGEFARLLKVYGREGQNCTVCHATIKRERISGRSVYICQACQKL